jgi:hypothetical protein
MRPENLSSACGQKFTAWRVMQSVPFAMGCNSKKIGVSVTGYWWTSAPFLAPQKLNQLHFKRAAAMDEFGQINPIQLALVRIGQERALQFGFAEPTADEIWRNRTVTAIINELTNGQTLSITLADGQEFNRLRKLAEDVLQGRRAMSDQEIVAVRKKYSDETG